MRITLEVKEKGGVAYRVTTNLFSIIAMERRFKIRASDLANGVAMEHLAFLAFEGAKQEGFTVPAVFDDYIKRLESVDVVEDEPVNPTGEAVTFESSAS
jgi:hypothetical protein